MEAVVTHTGCDFDSLASLIAAKKLYPDAAVILPRSLEKQVRQFLSLYQDAFEFTDEKYFDFNEIDKLVIVDTRLKSRIGQAKTALAKKATKVCIYDHHPYTDDDIEADKQVSRQIGATTTILLNEIRKRKIRVTSLEATLMCLGIYEDTGSLTFRTTSKEDIDAVSFLLSCGADLQIVAQYLNRELTEEELSILVELIQNTKTRIIKGTPIAICTIRHHEYIADLALLTHRLIDIENFNVIFVLAKTDSKIQMIARSSLPQVDVNKISSYFGGGGHASAASCMLKNKNLKQAQKELIEVIAKNIKPQILAKDIMSLKLKEVSENITIKEAKQIMTRQNLGELLALKKNRIEGIVTRSDLDKAVYHGFGHSRIKGYMSRQVITVKKNTPISTIKKIFFEKDIGRVPVVENEKILGLVTREDILNLNHKDLTGISGAGQVPMKESQDIPMIFKNITARMKENIPSDLYKLLKKIAGVADKEGTRIYLVGGAVRDIILKYKNLDIDIVVEGEAIKFALTLSKRLKAKLIVYQKFQTAILILPEGLRIDLASSRTEYYEYPAALPTVELSSIKHDLSRRDFTINAMAVSLNKDSFGRLIDFFGGLKDIKEKKIRVLHNLSFIEDPTRIFRAVRFETRFDFTIDEQTEHLIKTAVSEDMFEKIAGERMKDEIIPILCEPEPIKGVKRMHNLHELRFIHPKLKLTPVCVKYFKAIKKTLRWSEKNLKDKPVAWLLYFMALTTNLNSRQIKQVADRFVFSNKNAEKLFRYKKDNKRIIFALRSKTRMKASSIYKILNPYSIETLLMILTKVKNERSKKRIKRFFCDYKDKTLKVCGEDLKKLGLKPSKKFKNILNKVFYIKLDKGLKTKEEEMKVLRTIVEK